MGRRYRLQTALLDHGAKAVSLEAQPAFQVTGSGRAPTLPTSSLPSAGVVPVLNVPISLTYVTWGAWDIEDQTSVSGTLLRQIYISLVLSSLTDSHSVSDFPWQSRTVQYFHQGATSRDLFVQFRAVSDSVVMCE